MSPHGCFPTGATGTPTLRSVLLLAVLTAGLTACDREPPTAPIDAETAADLPVLADAAGGLGLALPFLGPVQLRRFERGSVVFQTVFTPETGLGPLFNADGCATCHASPAVGGVGPQVEMHATAFAGGVCEEHDDINGGSVLQIDATRLLRRAGINNERLATELPNLAVGSRTTPDLFGFGLLEAVPDEEILTRADPEDRDGDGISGRPNMTEDGEVGRFGRKGQVPDLLDFITDAFIYEQGITSPDEAEEQTNFGQPLPDGVDPAPDPELTARAVAVTVAFVRFLAPPPRLPLDAAARRGRETFSLVGCASCHVPTLRTGAHRVEALSHQVVHAYTDLLLHDMGADLADICNGSALPAEFRTEPLMGLRFSTVFLHDGRATSIQEAIRQHGGEAARARHRFAALSRQDRAELLGFLERL